MVQTLPTKTFFLPHLPVFFSPDSKDSSNQEKDASQEVDEDTDEDKEAEVVTISAECPLPLVGAIAPAEVSLHHSQDPSNCHKMTTDGLLIDRQAPLIYNFTTCGKALSVHKS